MNLINAAYAREKKRMFFSLWRNLYLHQMPYLYTDIFYAETLAWEKMSTTGILPHRAGHTSVAIGSNIFVFGGFTDARNLYDDLHVLDVGMCSRSSGK